MLAELFFSSGPTRPHGSSDSQPSIKPAPALGRPSNQWSVEWAVVLQPPPENIKQTDCFNKPTGDGGRGVGWMGQRGGVDGQRGVMERAEECVGESGGRWCFKQRGVVVPAEVLINSVNRRVN